MHAAIATAWLQFSEQTPWDVATVLQSAIIGNNLDAIVNLSMGLMSATDDVWRALSEVNVVYVNVYAGEGSGFQATICIASMADYCKCKWLLAETQKTA